MEMCIRDRRFIIDEKDTPEIYPYFLKAVAKRSYEELYNISSDVYKRQDYG